MATCPLIFIFTFPAAGFVTGNAADKVGLRSAAGRTVHMSREERMSRFAIRVATLTVLSVGIIATAPTIPVFAAGGGGGGGGGGPLDEDIMRPGSKPPPPQSAPAPRSTHRTKK